PATVLATLSLHDALPISALPRFLIPTAGAVLRRAGEHLRRVGSDGAGDALPWRAWAVRPMIMRTHHGADAPRSPRHTGGLTPHARRSESRRQADLLQQPLAAVLDQVG